jgi:hypothetical protein
MKFWGLFKIENLVINSLKRERIKFTCVSTGYGPGPGLRSRSTGGTHDTTPDRGFRGGPNSITQCVRDLDFLNLHLFVLHNTDTVSFPLSTSHFLRNNKRRWTIYWSSQTVDLTLSIHNKQRRERVTLLPLLSSSWRSMTQRRSGNTSCRSNPHWSTLSPKMILRIHENVCLSLVCVSWQSPTLFLGSSNSLRSLSVPRPHVWYTYVLV